MNPRRQEVEDALAKWYRFHHGMITLRETRQLGASRWIVQYKVSRGELVSPYPGVYRNTSVPRTHFQDLLAACLMVGGVVSHASAAWLWGLLREPPEKIEVSVARSVRRSGREIDFTIHRSRDLSGTTQHKGIPVTSCARTLVDLAATGTDAQLTEALDNALAKRIATVAALRAEIRRLSKPGRPGLTRLRRRLDELGFADAPPPSVLEAHLRRLITKLGIAQPTAEAVAGDKGQYRLDVAWIEIRYALEVDGYTWHFSPKHKRADELRRQRLREAGWTLLVFDWMQLTKRSDWVADEILATYQRLTAKAS